MKNKVIMTILFLVSTISAQYTISHDPIAFDPISVNTTSDIEVSLSSDIAQTVTLSGLDIASPFSLSDITLVYANAGDTENFTVSFTPTTATTYSAVLTITGSIFGTQEVDITGEGTLVEIALSQTTIDFGEVSLGDSSTTSIQVYNNGTGTMVVGPITSDDTQFYSVPNSLSIATGENETINIRFNPEQAGEHSATLSIPSNDPNTPVTTISMAGNGVTNISGDISGIWTPDNSPYYLVSHATIQNGESLTILPGVTVINNDDYYLYVYGSLTAEGTLEDSIKFISDNGGFLYYDDPDMSEIHLKYVSFSGSEYNFGNSGYSFELLEQIEGWSAGNNYNEFGLSSNTYNSGSKSLMIRYQNCCSYYYSTILFFLYYYILYNYINMLLY